MKFEENKVASAFNMHDVQLKDLGWFGNTRKELKMKVETEKPLQLIARDFTLAHIFQSEEGGRSIFFYPAPYEYFQAQWVKENNLKVGDKIKIFRSWERGEKGFTYSVGHVPIGEVVEVTGITSYGIEVIDTKGDEDEWVIPYYVIEKVTTYGDLFGAEYRVTLENVGEGVGNLVSLTHEFGGIMLKVNKNGVTLTFGEDDTLPEHFTIDEFYRVLEYIWYNRDAIEEDI